MTKDPKIIKERFAKGIEEANKLIGNLRSIVGEMNVINQEVGTIITETFGSELLENARVLARNADEQKKSFEEMSDQEMQAEFDRMQAEHLRQQEERKQKRAQVDAKLARLKALQEGQE
jgi:predicted nuclease with TOPRIM domain